MISEGRNLIYLLGKEILKDNIYNFEINPNTQFFLNKFNSKSSDFIIWNKLCLDFQVNNYNIVYIDFTDINQDNSGYSCSQKRYSRICHFNKERIIRESICYTLEDFKLLKIDKNPLLHFKNNLVIDNEQITESYKKLLFKISECKINIENKDYWICYLTEKKRIRASI